VTLKTNGNELNYTENERKEKKSPCPWDTHYQFSIKTLLSKENKKNAPQKKSPHTHYYKKKSNTHTKKKIKKS